MNVNCKPISYLLNEYDNEIDFLQVDAEGYDYDIIKTIDFKHRQPKVIHFEHCSLGKEKYAKCFKLLYKWNYVSFSSKTDTISIKKLVYTGLNNV